MANLLEEIISSRVALEPCGDNCDHTEAEHYAFDQGVRDGEAGKGDDSNPYEDDDLSSAWLAGHSVGMLNAEVAA